MTSSRLVYLTIATALGLVFLSTLGIWQLQRMAWKNQLLDTLNARAAARPVDLDAFMERWNGAAGTDDLQFVRVRAMGRYRHGEERHLYTISNGKAGWRIITPLETAGGTTVLIDRGFVPEADKDLSRRRDGAPEDAVSVVGLVRLGEAKGMFMPDNDVPDNQWFWRDLETMQAMAAGKAPGAVAEFMLQLEKSAHDAAWPRAEALSPDAIHNRHFSYALTWFGLAVALLTVYGLVLRARGKA